MPNLIYVTYADNGRGEPLENLKEEYEKINDFFMPLDAKSYLKFRGEEDATTEGILQVFEQYGGQIELFHFSGHANGQALGLMEGLGNANGLAQLLDDNKDAKGNQMLRLVFLNGCATAGQVAVFQRAGVPAIIATSTEVFDAVAATFSKAFYKALTERKKTIKEAFRYAEGVIKATLDGNFSCEIKRDLVHETIDGPHDLLPWGLYILDEGSTGGDWRLPWRAEKVALQYLSVVKEELNANIYMLNILPRICEVNKDIVSNDLEEYRNGERIKKDSSNYLRAIVKNFPWIIGSQIGLLAEKDKPNKERLEQLFSVYKISCQFIYYILLADSWRQKKTGKWKINEEQNFLEYPKNAEGLKKLDFSARILEVYQFVMANDGTFFSPEMAEFCRILSDEKSELYQVNKFLKEEQEILLNGGSINFVKVCEKIEVAISIFLSELAFLVGYSVFTVRDIVLDYMHTEPLSYDFTWKKLNGESGGGLQMNRDAQNRKKEQHSNTKSIIFSHSESDLSHALPLSPFIIDKNAFTGDDLAEIFLFAYEEGDHYYYYSIKHDFFDSIKGGKGFDLIDTSKTLEDFKEGTAYDQSENALDQLPFLRNVIHRTSTEIFNPLIEQHRRFKSEFTPHQNPLVDE